jgi:hypothetical protein
MQFVSAVISLLREHFLRQPPVSAKGVRAFPLPLRELLAPRLHVKYILITPEFI